jgi:type II secretory pathway component PulM
MNQWFNQLAQREQQFLMISAVILGLIMLYFLLWQPLIVSRENVKQRVLAQKATWRWMQTAALEIRQLRQIPSTTTNQLAEQSLLSLMETTIRGNLSKANKRIEPVSEVKVKITFEEVSFTELMQWLGRLYQQYQVLISELHIERQATADNVKARLTLTRQ